VCLVSIDDRMITRGKSWPIPAIHFD